MESAPVAQVLLHQRKRLPGDPPEWIAGEQSDLPIRLENQQNRLCGRGGEFEFEFDPDLVGQRQLVGAQWHHPELDPEFTSA